MARGNNKSQTTLIKGELPAETPERQEDWKRFTSEEVDAFQKASKERRTTAVNALLAMPEDKQAELQTAMRAYVKADHRIAGNDYKGNKEGLLAVLLSLPKEVRDYIERTPKEIFQSGEGYLVRGSDKKSSYMANGTAVASFSTSPDLTSMGRLGKMFGQTAYRLNDIAEYKGVFSFDRIDEIIRMANEEYKAKANFASNYQTPFRTWSGNLLSSRTESGEFFVYGIKWKDGVT